MSGSTTLNRPARRSTGLEPVPLESWLALSLAALAFSIVMFNVTGTNIAFASIAHTFDDASRTSLSWALSGYSITLATFMVLAGRMADRLGRRMVFFTGISVFLIGSLISASAPVAPAFIAGRVIQGLGGSLAVPSSLALVLPGFPASRRTTAVATWTACGSTGAAIAPSLSAFIVHGFGWRYVYLISIPIVTVVLVAGRRWLIESRADDVPDRIDLLGVPMGTIAIGLLALAIVQGPKWGWTSTPIMFCIVGTATLIPMFVVRSLRHPAPLLNLRLFKVRNVWTASVANIFLSMMGQSIWLVWPLFLTGIWGYSLLEAGLAITPGPICSATTGLISGRLADRYGPRLLISIGSLFPIFVMLWMTIRFTTEPAYWTTFFPAVACFGIGFGMTYSPLNSAALEGVSANVYGEVNAAFNTVRNLAGGLGVAIVVAILGDREPIPFAVFDRVFYLFAFLSAVPALVIYLFYPRHRSTA